MCIIRPGVTKNPIKIAQPIRGHDGLQVGDAHQVHLRQGARLGQAVSVGPYSTQHSTPTFQVQLFLRLTSPTHIRSSQPRSGASPIQVQYSVRLISITSFSLIQLQHQHSVAFCLCFPTRRQTINKASRQLPLTTPVTTSLHCMTALLLHRSPFPLKRQLSQA